MKVLLTLLVVLFVALQLRLWFGEGSIQEVWRLRTEVDASRTEVLRLTMRNQALAAEVADLKSGLDAIEERARADLGMVGKGEAFFQFVLEQRSGQASAARQPVANSALPDASPAKAEAREPVPRAQKP